MIEMDASLATLMIHADDSLRTSPAVASEISVSTTFRHPMPREGDAPDETDPAAHVYSRYSQPTLARAEKLLSTLLDGHAMLYSSGLGAAMAAMMFVKPKCLAITGGYHGVHEVIHVYQELSSLKVIALEDDYPEGTLCWLETPVNPKGEARDINPASDADKVHQVGGRLIIDSTFAPPPLQAPFKHGADIIMHSATKYMFGHSDALGGVLAVKTTEEREQLWRLRTFGGACPGSLEAWMLLRSLRTLTIRVERQAKTATELAFWLNDIAKSNESHDGCPTGILISVHHARLQSKEKGGFDAFSGSTPQLLDGPACFSIVFKDAVHAKWFPFELEFFVAATSLGGVESLVEQRIVSDPGEDPRLVRFSIGLENLEDLKADIRKAFLAVARRKQINGV